MKVAILFLTLIFTQLAYSQVEYKRKTFKVEPPKTSIFSNLEDDYHFNMKNVEAPLPSGESYRSFLLKQKAKQVERIKNEPKPKSTKSFKSKSFAPPIVDTGFVPRRIFPLLDEYVNGGIPSDNTLAVSNDGILLTSMNSVVHAFDINTNENVFENSTISLLSFVDGNFNYSYYDPKIHYDPLHDRFILVCLRDFGPSTSQIEVCFSSSSDPNDPWYVYSLPGNPLDNNRWTDFPAIAITDEKLYFTANLIIPNVSWQEGFDGSVIWEMDLEDGYSGSNDFEPELYYDIKFDGKFTRNAHPVPGAEGVAERMFFLSNRNFDLENDTIFFMEINEDSLYVDALKTDVPYGVPPNARQEDTDLSDSTSGLQTNDARVLGAYLIEDQIQFVGNTVNPETGFSAIYHGVVENVYDNPSVTGNIIGDSIKDYGYPNIAWSAKEPCDIESIIAFNFSSFDHYPGNATIHCNKDGNYSAVKTIVNGENWVNRLPGSYERWGDYYGLQRKYNEPGKVFSFGYYPFENKRNGGYIAYLNTPDTSVLSIDFELNKSNGGCDQDLTIIPLYGVPPFSYYVNGEVSDNKISGLCNSDTLEIEVVDARNCNTTKKYVVPTTSTEDNINVFPNPVSDWVSIQLKIPSDENITVELYDKAGRKVKVLAENYPVKSGLNELNFSIQSLASGVYNLIVFQNDSPLESFKIIKD